VLVAVFVVVADLDVGQRLGEGKQDRDEAHAGVKSEFSLVVAFGSIVGPVIRFVLFLILISAAICPSILFADCFVGRVRRIWASDVY
jgi:hypothetical protein